jgi:AcrR family transcriptional regulator
LLEIGGHRPLPCLDTTAYLNAILYLEVVDVKGAGMRRLSRPEAQARTREQLLDAAERAFAAEGFGGASLDRIAEAAGFTRGAVYSNFADKADLFVAVLDRRLRRRRDEVAATMRAARDPTEFLAELRAPAWSASSTTEGARQWVLLRDEFRLFALRNPNAAAHLAEHERHERDYYAQATAHLLGQLGVEPVADPRLVAAMVMALDESLTRQSQIDPGDVPESAFADALELLLQAAVALARQRADATRTSSRGRRRRRAAPLGR